MTTRVLHLVGSAENPFLDDLSRLYAVDCLAALDDPARYEHLIAHVSPNGAWRFPAGLSHAELEAAPALPLDAAVARLTALAPDVAVPQMFCLAGMTRYRALLELLGISYLGNRPEAMALTADKARAKAVVAAAGVRVPRGEVLRRGERPTLALPVVVKPARADNSAGVTLVDDDSGLLPALAAAFEHGDEALVEEYIPLGREVRCATLVQGGRVSVLPLEEYRLDRVRTAADKVARGDDGDLALMAKTDDRAWIVDADDPINAVVGEAARRAHAALGCRHYGLFDFRIDPAGQPWFLEAGLYLSFARQSVIAVMAGATGMDVPGLFATVLAESRRGPAAVPEPARPIHAA